jgi:hypothetical protein
MAFFTGDLFFPEAFLAVGRLAKERADLAFPAGRADREAFLAFRLAIASILSEP